MADLLERLTGYVTSGAHVSAADQSFIEGCLDEAIVLVNNLCGIASPLAWPFPSEGSTPTEPTEYDGRVPEAILHRAYIEVASELFNRRSAPHGISQFATPDGAPIRVGADVLVGARKMLAPFLPLGFA